jgi:hypothetical protein
MTVLPISLKELNKNVSPKLNAIMPRAILEIRPDDFMSCGFIRFRREGPMKMPTIIKAVTVGNFIL